MSFRTANDLVIDQTNLTTTDVRSVVIDMTYLDGISVQALTTGTIAGVVKLEVSNNNTDFVELASPTITITNVTSDIAQLVDIQHRYVKIFYDATSGTTNTLKVWITAKGK